MSSMVSGAPQAEDFLSLVLRNPANAAILGRLPGLGLPDAWLVSGSLFQTVWNLQDGHPPGRAIRDYDVFYFDSDTCWEAEDREIQRAERAFADLGVAVEVRNQARVHLWYKDKFGIADYPRLTSATDALSHFLADVSMVAVRPPGGASGWEICAPRGLGDVFAQVVRPNTDFSHGSRAERYREKARRWRRHWPKLTVLPWQ